MKKVLTWIIVIVIIIVLAALAWYIYNASKGNKNAPKSKTKTTVKKPTSAVPSGSQSSKWIPETFPLNVGMYGPFTQQLQAALGLPQDGQFGEATKAAVIARSGTVPLSLDDYNIMAIISQPVGAFSDGIVLINSDFSGNTAQVKEGDILGTIQQVVPLNSTPLQAGLLGGSYLIDTSTSNPPISGGNVYVQQSDVFFTDLK